MKISFAVLAAIIAIFVFAAVALTLALYAFLKIQEIHPAHECDYHCPESNNITCAYQTEEHMKNRTGGMNFSSLCHRDVYNCHNPKYSYKFDTKGPCITSTDE